MLSTSTQTVITIQTTNPNDRCNFLNSKIWSTDGSWSLGENYVNMQNLCPSSIWFETIHILRNKTVYLHQETFSKNSTVKDFGHIVWGTAKLVFIKTDSISVSRFFQTDLIPPPKWHECDFVLQFNFTMAHIPGKMNTASGFRLRLKTNSNDKMIPQTNRSQP